MTGHWDDVGCRVRLNVNLTRYHPSLVVGVEGVLVQRIQGDFDQMANVRFPEVTQRILWSGLDEIECAKDRCERAEYERLRAKFEGKR